MQHRMNQINGGALSPAKYAQRSTVGCEEMVTTDGRKFGNQVTVCTSVHLLHVISHNVTFSTTTLTWITEKDLDC